jgi:hypothetical protein
MDNYEWSDGYAYCFGIHGRLQNPKTHPEMSGNSTKRVIARKRPRRKKGSQSND